MTKQNEDKLITRVSVKGYIRFVVLFLILACFVVIAEKTMTNDSVTCEVQNIDDGWTAYAGGELTQDVTISQTQFPMQNEGDTLSFSRELPEGKPVSNPVLCIYSIHSEITVYLDGEQIYTTKADSWLEEILPGYGVNLVELPDTYPGQMLSVIYRVRENGSFEGLQAPVIMDGTKRTAYLFRQNRIGYFIVLALSLIGVVMMAISAFMSLRNRMFLRVFFIGGFSFLSGCWCMCNNEMLQLLVINISYKSYVEYVAFYLMIVPFVLYFWNRVFRPEIGKHLKIMYVTLVSILSLFFVMTQVCHYTSIAHYPKFVTGEHIMLVLSFIFYIVLVIEERRVFRKTEWMITAGFGAAILIAVFEMIRFNVEKYVVGFSNNKYNSTLEWAIFCVVIALGADFASKIFGALYRDARNKLLTEMAYFDELTGLNNRRYFTESIEKIKKANYTYSLVSLDMNLLKMMNDTYGHQVGDRALKKLSEVLRQSFPDDAIICRMGGDEFVIMIPNGDEMVTKRCITAMEREMERRNSNPDEQVILSTAYGYAFSKERATFEDVFKLADERMYACKEMQHLQRD